MPCHTIATHGNPNTTTYIYESLIQRVCGSLEMFENMGIESNVLDKLLIVETREEVVLVERVSILKLSE